MYYCRLPSTPAGFTNVGKEVAASSNITGANINFPRSMFLYVRYYFLLSKYLKTTWVSKKKPTNNETVRFQLYMVFP